MDFLKRAQSYAEANGDEMYFIEWYSTFRKEYDVRTSVWNALVWLYSDHIATLVESDVL